MRPSKISTILELYKILILIYFNLLLLQVSPSVTSRGLPEGGKAIHARSESKRS